jgi:hypothetical protein
MVELVDRLRVDRLVSLVATVMPQPRTQVDLAGLPGDRLAVGAVASPIQQP